MSCKFATGDRFDSGDIGVLPSQMRPAADGLMQRAGT